MKAARQHVIYSLASLLALALAVPFFGCEEKEVPVIIDADEIMKYVSQEEIARELFRTDGFFTSDPYTVPFDSATFSDRIIDRKRIVEVNLVPLKVLGPGGDSIDNDPERIYADHGILGKVRESVVSVRDEFTIEITRQYADTTLYDTTDVYLNRYGFFLKAGDDSRPYVGWVLWGFNGAGSVAPPIGIELEAEGGSEFRGDFGLYSELPKSRSDAIPKVPYVPISELDTVPLGSRLHITTYKATSTGRATYQLVSDYGADGAFTQAMHRYDDTAYYDSVSYIITSSNARFYDQVMIQALTDQAFPIRSAYTVPYRN